MLEVAITDGRRVLAGGREGFWLWRIGGEPQITERTTDLTNIASKELAAAWGKARVVTEKVPGGAERGVAVEVSFDGRSMRHVPDGGSRVTAIELIDGDVWIGHDRGIDVLRREEVLPASIQPKGAEPAPPATEIRVLHRWTFEGPVQFIYPERVGGGASVVSLHGGFILVKPVAVGEAPSFKGRGEVD